MYQLLSQGEHPYYSKGELYNDYMEKLLGLRSKPIPLPKPAQFSDLAFDLFKKLCIYPALERYDAKTALRHPWLTGNSNGDIPLTYKQQIQNFDSELALRKVMRLCFFMSQIKAASSDCPVETIDKDIQDYKKLLHKNSFISQDSTTIESSSRQSSFSKIVFEEDKQPYEYERRESFNNCSGGYQLGGIRKRESSQIKQKKQAILRSAVKNRNADNSKYTEMKSPPQNKINNNYQIASSSGKKELLKSNIKKFNATQQEIEGNLKTPNEKVNHAYSNMKKVSAKCFSQENSDSKKNTPFRQLLGISDRTKGADKGDKIRMENQKEQMLVQLVEGFDQDNAYEGYGRQKKNLSSFPKKAMKKQPNYNYLGVQ